MLLLHLIKQAAEQRTTRSWAVSVRNAVRQINKINTRRKSGGWYLNDDDLFGALEESYESALDSASLEAFRGQYTTEEVRAMIDRSAILQRGFEHIQQSERNP